MKAGDMIQMTCGHEFQEKILKTGLVIRVGERHNGRTVATVMVEEKIETWPLDGPYQVEVLSETRRSS